MTWIRRKITSFWFFAHSTYMLAKGSDSGSHEYDFCSAQCIMQIMVFPTRINVCFSRDRLTPPFWAFQYTRRIRKDRRILKIGVSRSNDKVLNDQILLDDALQFRSAVAKHFQARKHPYSGSTCRNEIAYRRYFSDGHRAIGLCDTC